MVCGCSFHTMRGFRALCILIIGPREAHDVLTKLFQQPHEGVDHYCSDREWGKYLPPPMLQDKAGASSKATATKSCETCTICVEAEVAIAESKWFLERAVVSVDWDGGGQNIYYQSSWKVLTSMYSLWRYSCFRACPLARSLPPNLALVLQCPYRGSMGRKGRWLNLVQPMFYSENILEQLNELDVYDPSYHSRRLRITTTIRTINHSLPTSCTSSSFCATHASSRFVTTLCGFPPCSYHQHYDRGWISHMVIVE